MSSPVVYDNVKIPFWSLKIRYAYGLSINMSKNVAAKIQQSFESTKQFNSNKVLGAN